MRIFCASLGTLVFVVSPLSHTAHVMRDARAAAFDSLLARARCIVPAEPENPNAPQQPNAPTAVAGCHAIRPQYCGGQGRSAALEESAAGLA